MTSAPRVTVVMPVFNGARFIGEAVASVLASDFRDLELLVLDDESTDASIAEASRAAAGDPRLRIVRLRHGGVAAARNAGLQEALGELIANLDADDLMYWERLAIQVGYLDHHAECVAVGSRVLMIDAAGHPTAIGIARLTHEEIDAAHLGGRGGALGNPTAMFRKAAALAVGGYRTDLDTTGEDLDLWLRMAEIGRLANLPEVLTQYRIHGRNVSLNQGDIERRRAVALATVTRAFERRRITDRQPALLPAPPSTRAERWRDAALLRYFSGDRGGAMLRILGALLLNPAAVGTRAAFRTIRTGQPAYRPASVPVD